MDCDCYPPQPSMRAATYCDSQEGGAAAVVVLVAAGFWFAAAGENEANLQQQERRGSTLAEYDCDHSRDESCQKQEQGT